MFFFCFYVEHNRYVNYCKDFWMGKKHWGPSFIFFFGPVKTPIF